MCDVPWTLPLGKVDDDTTNRSSYTVSIPDCIAQNNRSISRPNCDSSASARFKFRSVDRAVDLLHLDFLSADCTVIHL